MMSTKTAFGLPPNLMQQISHGWQSLGPQGQHALIGAGVGGLGGLLSGGPDEHGETHRLRNMMLGAGLGAGVGGLGGGHIGRGMDWARQQMQPSQLELPFKLSAAYDAGKTAALKRYGAR